MRLLSGFGRPFTFPEPGLGEDLCNRRLVFRSRRDVIYANPSLGMGLVFGQVKPHFLAVLRKWLLAAMQGAKSEEKTLKTKIREKPPEEHSSDMEWPALPVISPCRWHGLGKIQAPTRDDSLQFRCLSVDALP
jgi:hypothetical protein